MESLVKAFKQSRVLKKHIRFMYSVGGVYKIHNNNLLYHGCVPMTEDGGFESVKIFGEPLAGKAYLDACDRRARSAYYNGDTDSLDFMYYLWCGRKSPLFGKDRITTFERYFISDKNYRGTEDCGSAYAFPKSSKEIDRICRRLCGCTKCQCIR